MFDTIADQAPIAGKILTTFKIHRLQQRIKHHEKGINYITEKVRAIDDPNFKILIKDFLFPDLLQQLLDEDEDQKISYFLNGFCHVIDNEIYDRSKILIYYDALISLRFVEIEYLLTFTSEYNKYRYHKVKHNDFEKHFTEKREFWELKSTIENKLESMNLISTGRLVSYTKIMKKMNKISLDVQRGLASPRSEPDETKITEFGKRFVYFFNLAAKYEIENKEEAGTKLARK
ncbi:hypothetical protein [Ornithinibacillus sp. FSL M8-0202]|uniref:hypothetical protein n=1 Tax=Ornithinibacillus sp. FSL M8-0202 TaxID=2921616 RepID=UPI0030D23B38